MQTAADSATPEELRDFSDFVARVMEQWQVPGIAVAVAKDGRIVLAEGFGVRDLDAGLPVTPRTLFAVGSCTKAFTTTSLALLADDGALDWDAPVKTYLPDFALRDPVASERITARDLVTHRSGLPRHDLVWYGSPASRPELVARLRHLEPTEDFRATWQYQYLMYLAAGYLAGRIAGQEWEGLVRQRLFAPLGMSDSNFSVARSQESADAARPYQERDGQVTEMPFRAIDAIAPAGAINSSVEEMGRWLLLHVNKGTVDGQRIVSEAQVAQLHAPQMVMPDPGKYAEVSLPSYALGWFVESYRGQTVVHHGGNIDGFSALVAFIQRTRIGVVALTNLNAVPLPTIVAYHVFDRLLGLDEIPWHDRFLADRGEQKAAGTAGKTKVEADRVAGTHPSHTLADYAGDYAHPAYGTMTVELDGDGLALRYNSFAGPLRHHHYDVFEFNVELIDERYRLVFATDVAGELVSLSAPLEPTVPDIVFTR